MKGKKAKFLGNKVPKTKLVYKDFIIGKEYDILSGQFDKKDKDNIYWLELKNEEGRIAYYNSKCFEISE